MQSKIFESRNYQTFPKVTGYRLLWHIDYHDGPRDGICEYNGKKYFFSQCDDWFYDEFGNNKNQFDDGVRPSWRRRYVLIELTPEQLNEEMQTHKLFQQFVGVHTDYDAAGKRTVGETRPDTEWHKFYDVHENKPPKDYTKNKIIGWFEK